ncbi:ParB/RepB/Spo0J family partition protein [Francisella sp. 19X1-34]|uniref:ParB/RepB/Spo0J family partition protein n=1 Tax=Francisella sp. 19X1-34 TaxID=3087177 RepID=UPI002E30D68A|nr:ParB/RepB/Spo0J family partition protein [Francisella sp. 19X1-34]MED7789473.1 ParB/RepB/Spo0J family partition protein [Francisella sp. 19X1-34]
MTQKKWQDPLEKLLNADNKISSINDYMNKENFDANKIHEIDPSKIRRWIGKDRPENELGNIEELAESLKTIGQQVPCIVRPIKNTNEYELIVGECRWRAATLANIKLKVLIHKLDDRTAALVQAVENEQRNDLSDYAKGMSYAKKISEGLLTQKDLTDILKISKQQVSRLLSFSKISENINNAIKDYRKVSARTAYEISRLGNKSIDHQKIIIAHADKIKEGKIGSSSISKLIDKEISNNKSSSKKYYSKNGDHVLTIRDDSKRKSLHFSSKISEKITKNTLDNIIEEVLKCIN